MGQCRTCVFVVIGQLHVFDSSPERMQVQPISRFIHGCVIAISSGTGEKVIEVAPGRVAGSVDGDASSNVIHTVAYWCLIFNLYPDPESFSGSPENAERCSKFTTENMTQK